MADGHYRYPAFLSYAHDDDTAWGSWITHFDAELNRSLPGRLRDLGCPIPGTFLSSRNGPVHGPLNSALRQAIDESFAMVVFVHDAYLLSEWCLKELAHFRDLHGIWGMRNRLFIVAMSQEAIDKLAKRPEWQDLFPDPDPVWIPFHQGPAAHPNRPIGMYLTARNSEAVMANEFLTPFFRVREALADAIREAADEEPELFRRAAPLRPPPAPAVPSGPAAPPEALLYIESERDRAGYWEPLGLQISEAWNSLNALDTTDPKLLLRPTGLPMHDLRNRPRLDEADGVILLWDEKTPESLLAQIEMVEPKLNAAHLAPGLIAYLMNVDLGTAPEVPRSMRGWPVVRFATRRQDPATATAVRDDVDRLNRYLRHVLKHKRKQMGHDPVPTR